MKKLNYLLVIAIAIVSFYGCAKDGDTGPQGPAGANGINGTNGTNGNANVHCQLFTSSAWTYTAPAWGLNMTDNDINQAIVDSGMVMVYLSNGNGGWQALPFTSFPSASYASSFVFVYYLNGVTVWKTDSDLTQPTNPGARTFKVITISASQRIANPNVNWTNYQEVSEVLHLDHQLY